MSATEQRELDAWIAENVMGYRRTENPDDHTTDGATLFWHRTSGPQREVVLKGRAYTHGGMTEETGKEMFSHSWTFFEPTTDPVASDALDDAILNHPMGNHRIELVNGIYYFTSTVNPNIGCEYHNKKICRALFAQKLFSK